MSQMKKLLESLDKLQECPPDMAEGPMAAPMSQGTPVSMNVSLNASGADHVADLINMMKNAGLGDAKPAADAMLPMRQDMERLRAMVDEPEMEADEVYADATEDEIDAEEGYDNEPDPEYQDHKYMTKDLSGGLNREKKAYAAAQDGDNAMAVEAIKAQLMAALEEKKAKPDFLDMDKDGDKKEPMKKAIADKKKKGPVEEVYNKTHVGNINDPETQKKMDADFKKGVKAGQELKKMSKDKKEKKTDEGIISTVKKAYQDAKKEKERNAYHNKLAGDALKRMEPKELKPYYDAMRDKKKKK